MLKSNGDWDPKSDHVLHLGRFVYPLVALLAYVLTITPRLHDDGIRTNEERCAYALMGYGNQGLVLHECLILSDIAPNPVVTHHVVIAPNPVVTLHAPP